jgi:hypothetical protein
MVACFGSAARTARFLDGNKRAVSSIHWDDGIVTDIITELNQCAGYLKAAMPDL